MLLVARAALCRLVRGVGSCLAFWVCLAGSALFGQGLVYPVYQMLQTGTGGPLTIASQTFAVDSLQPVYQLSFAFGFATEEQSTPSQFSDAATITLQDAGQTTTVIYLTVDRNGVSWAPTTPGTYPLNATDMHTSALTVRDQTRLWAYQTAYWVTAPVPSQLGGKIVSLHLDLFDNGDSSQSMAWISQVPEPGSGVLLVVGLLVWAVGRKLSR
jgi:hypothetical protein